MDSVRLMLAYLSNDRVPAETTYAGDGLRMQVGDDFSLSNWIRLEARGYCL